tara:strand:+ start:254 stop:586 length:333 start_codon:yes stop_codon:yes gene_type:complete
METCPYCGQAKPEKAERFGLMVQLNPPALFWRGIRILSRDMYPTRYRILMTICRFGAASDFALLMQIGESSTPPTLKVHISAIRKALRLHNIPIKVRNINGWGYELCLVE